MPSDSKPLCEMRVEIPFDEITPDCIEPAIDALIADAQQQVNTIVQKAHAERTLDNTLLNLDRATERIEYARTLVGHLESVATTPELRAAYDAIEPKVSAFFSSLPLNDGLWKALVTYSKTENARGLTGPSKRFLEKSLDGFRRHGAELPSAEKEHLTAIDLELARITTRFRQNALDATNAFELLVTDESKLAGLPKSAQEAARQSAKSKGKEGWRFTLHAPSYIAVMTYQDDRAIRETIYRARSTLATQDPTDNRPLISRILELRREQAKLLGYAHFADFVLAERMAKTGEHARDFLTRLRRRSQPFFDRENQELAAFIQDCPNETAAKIPAPLQPWDIPYWSEKQRRGQLDFDEEELRPYFPLQNVIEGLFQLVNRLYGIQIEKTTDRPTWHPDVQVFQILDPDGIRPLGFFYADLFPRETKRAGAWMNAFITGHEEPETRTFTPHVGLICGNLTPAVGTKPALLSHRDLETLFHEFGHLLHHCLSRVAIRSQAGTNVAWDFVELPSQIMENWCWERECLDLFARHFETGEPIPDELFSKLVQTRRFRSANAMMRQLGLATLDLALHIDFDPSSDVDAIAFAREILQQSTPAPLPADYAMVASFGHLFASSVGYAAGYYSYKWAEVLDADAFDCFAKAGIFDRSTGLAFWNEILARGDTEDPNLLIREFLGREPNEEAMFARAGLSGS